ncbi:type IV toxin-antitoxin system AbiEi family antitoxin domain-containing protein [Kineococcus sp. SYSU DK004]|uniref:type IV toxin-antitoxin system AbiEi family antitoxin domain-containing protein n=1 Tax=Kineococcus sp. SYSU DK004 TaxID=3383125 RepID=UPI003D7CEA7B
MPDSIEALGRLGDLAMDQWGLFTSSQARQEGLTPQQLARLTKTGALERLAHGIYRVVGAPIQPHDELRAAWLALAPKITVQQRLESGPTEVVSHRSAADLHDLGDLDADELEFTVKVRKQTRNPQVRFHKGEFDSLEWTIVDGLPVTSITRTIEDLAKARVDGGHLAGIVRDAITARHVDVDDIADALAPYAHYYGAPIGQGAALVQQLLKQAGVPRSTQVASRLFESNTIPFRSGQKILESMNINLMPGILPSFYADWMRPVIESNAGTQKFVAEIIRSAAMNDALKIHMDPIIRSMDDLAKINTAPIVTAIENLAKSTSQPLQETIRRMAETAGLSLDRAVFNIDPITRQAVLNAIEGRQSDRERTSSDGHTEETEEESPGENPEVP